MGSTSFALLLLSLISCTRNTFTDAGGLDEGERLGEYYKRGHTWPPKDEEFVPPSDGWRRIMRRRLAQVRRIEDSGDMYNGWVATVHCALTARNFTEYGWAVTRAPQALINELSSSLHGGMATRQLPTESEHTDCIDAEERPLFHNIGNLDRRALMELRPIAEAWVNHDQQDERVHLIGNNAYGLRIYRRGSRLHMHVDKSSTHIVSAILHVDHDENSEPWPIVIEDYYGNLNEVILEKGDVLLYESSKCWHGRPRRFVGEWYTSLFVHFYPSDWGRTYDDLDVHYRIPPGWNDVLPKKEGLEALVMAETSAYEPDCVDTWCALNDTIKWDARGEFGKHLSGDGVVRDLEFERKKIRVPVHWSDEL